MYKLRKVEKIASKWIKLGMNETINCGEDLHFHGFTDVH